MTLEAMTQHPAPNAAEFAADTAYQDAILQGVSRTFALTIPQLSSELRTVVGNAYLLCRITDTIEDSDTLTVDEKKRAYQQFVASVATESSEDAFARDWGARFGGKTLQAERDLIQNSGRILRITHSFDAQDQAALLRCVRIMAEGMQEFQTGQFAHGLRDLAHLDAYCYHVAGVVGETLTELFCAHSPAIAVHREALANLAVSFGQGLQMTNILKDIWDDHERGVCWLPQSIFTPYNFDLAYLAEANHHAGFQEGLADLIGIARHHLDNAMAYTLLIPTQEAGIRRFCLWATGMAILTLRRIDANRGFRSGAEVKISRRSVKATIAATQLFGWSNPLLLVLYRLAARGLPPEKGE